MVSIAAVTSSCEKVKRLEDVQVAGLNISPGRARSLLAQAHMAKSLLSQS